MKNKKRLQDENFCLIKYPFTALGMRGVEYEVIFHPEKEDTGVNIVSKDEAMEIIERFNMTKVLTTKNGTIWEKENQPFLAEHQNFFARKEEEIAQMLTSQEEFRKRTRERELERGKRWREKRKMLAQGRQVLAEESRSAGSADENCQ